MPKLKGKYYVSAESIKDLPDAPQRRKKIRDEGFVKTSYTNNTFLKRKSEAKNGNSSKKVKMNSSRNENAFDNPALESANVQINLNRLVNCEERITNEIFNKIDDEVEGLYIPLMEEETENKNLITILTPLPKHLEAEIIMEKVVINSCITVAPDSDETEIKVLAKGYHHVLPVRDLEINNSIVLLFILWLRM